MCHIEQTARSSVAIVAPVRVARVSELFGYKTEIPREYGQLTENENGDIRTSAFAGTYAVNADCTGSAAFNSGGTLDLVIVSIGEEIDYIVTVPGTAISGVLKQHNSERVHTRS